MSEALADVKQRALALLTRREHSEKELRNKLRERDIDTSEIDIVIDELKREGLQSDLRFTEAFVHDRVSRGYGPRHISQELKQKGIGADISAEFIDERDPGWLQRMIEVHHKKFGAVVPDDYREQARQSRFLQYRGFSGEQIQRLFGRLKNDDD